MKKKLLVSLALLSCGLLAYWLFASLPGFASWYSRTIIAPLSAAMGSLSAAIPFPLFEAALLLLAIAFLGALIGSVVRSLIRRTGKPFHRFLDNLLLSLALIVVGYVLLWTPVARSGALGNQLSVNQTAYTVEALDALCRDLIHQANALNSEVSDAQGRYQLPHGTKKMLEASTSLLIETPFIEREPAAPKLARYSEWMKLFNIAGLYSPWTGETLISEKEYIVNLPFTACHEAAHAAGIGREEEANFVAYLACMKGDAHFQYSGTLSALLYAMEELKSIDRPAWVALRQEMSFSVQGDFYRMNGFDDARDSKWSAFIGGGADIFLRLGGQGGVGSYSEMTGLLLKWRELNSEAL